MSILITGALGFLGRVIVDNLRGKEKLVLLGRIDKGENSDLFYKDVNSVTDYSDCLTGVGCIIHCAARVHIMGDESNDPLNDYREVNTLGTLNLARQAVEFGVKRFIFISSIKANGEDTNHIPPFNTESSRSPKDFYAQSKSEAEIQLMALAEETGLEVVIIRPPLVYGAGVRANFASLMKLVSKGFPLPFGSIRSNKRSLVSVSNLVDLVITCINHPKAKNQIFLVSDGQDLSTSSMISEMAVACGRASFQIPVPIWCYKLVGTMARKQDVVERLIGSLQVDISHTRETLDWTPPQSLQDGFKETADFILCKEGKNK